jgi:hypothetical protein
MLKKGLFSLFRHEGIGRIMAGLVVTLVILMVGTSAQAAITITNQSGSVVVV